MTHGQSGEIMGPATLEGYVGKGVTVKFPGNTAEINLYSLRSAARSRDPRPRGAGRVATSTGHRVDSTPPLPGVCATGALVLACTCRRMCKTQRSCGLVTYAAGAAATPGQLFTRPAHA